MNRNNLEIYIHIPFCVRKCAYCDFLSGPANGETRARYLAGLFDEFRFRSESLFGRRNGAVNAGTAAAGVAADGVAAAGKREITSVFVGGGTPSSLNAGQLDTLFEKLYSSFPVGKEAEITVECNPGTLDASKLSVLKNAGVNRLSIGLQSADDTELKTLGRIHTYGKFLEEYELARKTGFSNINIDIMQALPGQTVEKALYTVNNVIGLQPEHISAYSLIIEEGTPFFERFGGHPELLPDEETDRAIYHKTEEALAGAGFEHYEISNYAKPGFECRHNTGYWTGTDYIGMGLGAASLIDGTRFSNVRDLKQYTDCFEQAGEQGNAETACKDPVDKETVEVLTEAGKMAEFMFLGLRLVKGVEKAEFTRRFGKSAEAVYGDIIRKHVRDGLLKDENGRIALTERGLDLSNTVMCDFLQE